LSRGNLNPPSWRCCSRQALVS